MWFPRSRAGAVLRTPARVGIALAVWTSLALGQNRVEESEDRLPDQRRPVLPPESFEPPPPTRDPTTPPPLTILLGPVPGFTTGWHPAPASLVVPLGVTVAFKVNADLSEEVTWLGAAETGRDLGWSFAECPLTQLSEFSVSVRVGGRDETQVCILRPVAKPADAISVSGLTVVPDEFHVDPGLPWQELNGMTMAGYAQPSIAAIRRAEDKPGARRAPVPGRTRRVVEPPVEFSPRYLTSVNRPIPVSVTVDPPVFASLMEWRVDGRPAFLGAETQPFVNEPGVHVVSVGPPGRSQEFEIEAYRASIISHVDTRDIVPERTQTTFEAVTDPPGYESLISWLSSTKYGAGTPVLGSGPTFTVQFDNTWGPHPDGGVWQWLGVKADNSAFNQDQKCPPTCPPVTCYRCDIAGNMQTFEVAVKADPGCYEAGGFPFPVSCYPGEDDDDPPPSDCGCCGQSGTSEYPVHLFSGEKLETAADLQIPGRGFDFVLTRTYRSQAEQQTIQGYNWGMSYDIRFERQSSTVLVMQTGDLRRDEFFRRLDGSYHRREFFDLIEISDEPNGAVTMRTDDGGMWSFSRLDDPTKPGRIVSMMDRNNNQMTFDYDALGRLVKIHDSLDTVTHNRDIAFAYNADGFLSSVTEMGFLGRQITYAYYQNSDPDGSFGDLKSVTTPAATGSLPGNEFPLGKTTTYKYSKGFADPRLNHNLISITDPKGQVYKVVTYETNTSSPDVDRVKTQVLGGGSFEYVYVSQTPAPMNGFATLLTIVNDRVGNVSHHYFDEANRLVLMREFTGRAPNPNAPTTLSANLPTGKLRSEDPDYFETRQTYDANSALAFSKAPNGQSTVSDIDTPNSDPRARGNVMTRTQRRAESDPDQTDIVEQFEYLGSFGGGGCCGGGSGFITMYKDGRGNTTMHDYDLANGNRIGTTRPEITQGVFGGGTQTIDDAWLYNAFGQVTQYTNPQGRVDTWTYYTSGPMAGYLQCETVDSTGFALQTCYEYDAVGNVTRRTDPRGNDTLIELNALNQAVRVKSRLDPNGVRYETDTYYDANDNVVRVDVQNVDEDGTLQPNTHFTTINEYDIMNDLTKSCHESGSFTGAIPGTTSLPTCIGLPDAQFVSTVYLYDGNKNRTLVRFGEAAELRQTNNAVRTQYDERNLIFKEIRGNGTEPFMVVAGQSTTQYDYDINRNLIRKTTGLEGPSPRVHTYSYDSYNRLSATTDPMGNVAQYEYDDNGNRTSVRIDGQLTDVTGSTGNTRLSETTYTYDEDNRLITTETAFFNPQTQAAIGNGVSISRTYYNENSDVIRVEDDRDNFSNTCYDTLNRPSLVTDAKLNTVTYIYDANSNVTQTVEVEKSDLGNPPQSFTTTYVYDKLDRLTSTTDNSGNTMNHAYDSRGNGVLMTDALTRKTRYVYDGQSRLTSTIRDLDGDGPDGDGADIVTTQDWDDTSRLTGQGDDNGNVTAYAYDALNRLTTTSYADNTSSTDTYDVHDNRTTMTDANGSVVSPITYDLLNRVTAKTITRAAGVLGTTSESYQYDGMSRLTQAEDNDSRVTREYDSLSNVTREVQNQVPPFNPGNDKILASTFDGVGNKLTCTYPGGRVVTNTYDSLNRKQIVADGGGSIATYSFVGPGRVERRDYGNGTRTDYTYDGITGVPNPAGDFGVRRIIGTTHTKIAGGIVLDDRTFKWDRMGNKTQRKDVRAAGPRLTHDYSYDAAYRLAHTVVTDPTPALIRDTTYNLDGVGNRTTVLGMPDTKPYVGAYSMNMTTPEPNDFDVNQYTTTPGDARTYDKNGNLTTIDPPPPGAPTLQTIVYDYRNQMIQHTDSATGTVTTYAYDALGRRIRKTVGAAETRFVLDGWQEIEEQSAAGATLATYTFGLYIDEVLNMTRGGVRYFYHADDLYNVMAVTDAAAAVVERYEYQDYGRPSFFTGAGDPIAQTAIGNPLLFTGRRHDAETGFYYYRTRYHDPIAGRFATRDTIGIWGDSQNAGNGYAYVSQNPWTSVDPFGLAEGCPYALIGKKAELVSYSKKYENCAKDDRKLKITHEVEVSVEGSVKAGEKDKYEVSFKVTRSEKMIKEEEITIAPCMYKQFKYTFDCKCESGFWRNVGIGATFGVGSIFWDCGYWNCTQTKDTLLEGKADCPK